MLTIYYKIVGRKLMRNLLIPSQGCNFGLVSSSRIISWWTLNAKTNINTKNKFNIYKQLGTSSSKNIGLFIKSRENNFVRIIRKYSTSSSSVIIMAGNKDKKPTDRPSVSKNEDPEATEVEEFNITLSLSDEDLQTLTNGDPDIMKKVEFLQMEHEVLRQEGRNVPTQPIDLIRWEELLNLPLPHQRLHFYNYLFKKEMIKKRKAEKQEKWKEKRLEFLQNPPPIPSPEQDPHHMFYGLNHNTLFLRLDPGTEKQFYNHRAIQAMQFGQPFIIDCGYDQQETRQGQVQVAEQIIMAFSENRAHPDPFNFHICNLAKDTLLENTLGKMHFPVWDSSFPVNASEQSYLDLFPDKSRLVYLTSHAYQELLEYSEDDIYIVGGLIDRSKSKPFTLAKAKREGLKFKKLPIDSFLRWGNGHKSLPLNLQIKILLDWKLTKDWKFALRHIPVRCLLDPAQEQRVPKGMYTQPWSGYSRAGQKTILRDTDEEDKDEDRRKLAARDKYYAHKKSYSQNDSQKYSAPTHRSQRVYMNNSPKYSISNGRSSHNYKKIHPNDPEFNSGNF